MNLFIIAKSNIKKNRSMTFTLVVLIIFAAILLYIGSSILLKMNSFLDEKNNELNGSDFTVFAPKEFEGPVHDIFKKVDGYTQYEEETAISASSVFQNKAMNEKGQSMDCLILNAEKSANIAKLKILYQGDKKQENSIILPYYLKVAKGYHTGDKITITYQGKAHNFVIYGFSEDIMFAIPSNISVYKCYVFNKEFNKLYQEGDNLQFFLIKTKLKHNVDTNEYGSSFIKDMNHIIPESNSQISAMDYDSMKVGVSIFFTIIMVILIVFSVIIMLIALTVIRFAVVTFIEGNIKNIGSMEALGYTGRELILGMVLQFALISLASIIIGLLIAVSCTGIITNIVSSSIGLIWNNQINLLAVLINFMVIMFLVIAITYMTAGKVKKITPITAIRSGIDTHNFRKNYFSLDKSQWNVNVLVGLKSLMHNMKQNITIFIIISLMSFVCVFAFTANYNFVTNNTSLLTMIGLEKSHLLVNYFGSDSTKVFNEIGKMNQVNKTIRLTKNDMTLYKGSKEATISMSVCQDFNQLNIKSIVKGRYPIHDNEIALTGLVLKQLGAELGDAITIKGTNGSQDYIIVGKSQQISNLGKAASITEEGMKRINPGYMPSSLYVYLNSSENIKSTIKEIEHKYSSQPLSVINMEEQFNLILDSFNNAIVLLCIGCIVITLLIISLVLFLLIKIKLIKERIRIGVCKALGYTTKQLIFQIICSFFPVCLLGAAIGTFAAMNFINPILAFLLSIGGSIENSHFIISPLLTISSFLAISIFSVIVTAIVARSIRKITPCELFQ